MDRQLYLEQIDRVNEAGPYHADWDSIAQHTTPAWYVQKRLGIFLHWGVFSVPAYHDWYARNMYIKDSEEYKYHIEHFGPHKGFGWKDFVPMFTMDKFNPDDWVKLFTEAGAEYIVPVAEHHDGFQNYRSELSHWNAAEMGPHRDIMGDLLNAAERGGMTLGTSSHRVEHWFFLGHGKDFDSDVNVPLQRGDLYWPAMPEPANHHDLFGEPQPTQEFLEDWLLRSCEIVDRYHPSIFYFDWWIQHSAVTPYLKKFAAYYYNRMEDRGGCVINYKHDAFPFGCAVPDIERGAFAEAKPFLWQSDTSVMRGSWCYSEQPDKATYKSPQEIVWTLMDCISKNGRLLLNVGPTKDGRIDERDAAVLRGLGAWMKVNDEAVHGTGVWRMAQEGPTLSVEGQFSDGKPASYTSRDFRFSCRGKDIYATCMVCPADGKVDIVSLREADASSLPLFHAELREVHVLGCDKPLQWTRDGEALHVDLGDYRSDMPIVIRVTCA